MLERMLEENVEGMLALFCITENCQEPHCQFILTNAGRMAPMTATPQLIFS